MKGWGGSGGGVIQPLCAVDLSLEIHVALEMALKYITVKLRPPQNDLLTV